MARTWLRQETQVRNSRTYDDTVAAGATMESTPVNIEEDLNSLRSQAKRFIWADAAGDWYDDVPTHNSKKRGLDKLNEDLDDIEVKPFLFRSQILTDISVPAGVAATGTLTLNSAPSNNDTVTIGTTTYTFKTVLTPADWEVLIEATASDSLDNLIWAINNESGHPGKFQVPNAHPDVTAAAGAGDTMDVTAIKEGTAGNTIATTDTLTDVLSQWGAATLTGGEGDRVVLSVAGSEAPSQTAAVGAVATEGAVVAYNSAFDTHSMAEVAGPSALQPYNLCIIRDTTTSEAIISENGKEVYGLLQSESNVDGHTFDDAGNQVMIAFVEENSDGDDLIATSGDTMGGRTINYLYNRRLEFDNVPQWAFLTDKVFVDNVGVVDVTLDRAIDNQSGPATQTDRDIEWRITDTYTLDFQTSDGGVNLLRIIPNAAGDEIEINVDDLDVNTVNDSDFSQGAKFDTGGTEIDIGVTAGHVETTGANDFHLQAGGEMYLDDGNQTGSTWAQTDGIKLSEDTDEWDDFETAYGEVSLLNAILQAGNQGKRGDKVYANCTTTTAVDTDVGGVGGGANLDAQLPDMSNGAFLTDYDVYLNGALLRPGADAAANNDYYPGTSLANGQLKFEFVVVINDVLCVIPYDADDIP